MSSSSKKLFYTVGDIADELEIPPHRIRYWCDEFPQLEPPRSPGGQRQFRKEDRERLRQIYHLVEEEKYTVEGARERLKTRDENPDLEESVKTIQKICDEGLQDIREFMESL